MTLGFSNVVAGHTALGRYSVGLSAVEYVRYFGDVILEIPAAASSDVWVMGNFAYVGTFNVLGDGVQVQFFDSFISFTPPAAAGVVHASNQDYKADSRGEFFTNPWVPE